MDSKDLRIGNYVYDLMETEFVITAIGQGVTMQNKGLPIISEGFSRISPIPLTEEWLVKFGWKIGKYQDAYYLDNLEIYSKDGEFTVNDHVANCTLCFLKYVHSLQNLYFALTGKELDGKL